MDDGQLVSEMGRPDEAGKVSRRRVLGGAGLAAAGGVALATGGSAVMAGMAAADDGRGIATGPAGTTTVEFVSRIAQTGSIGQAFTSYGYLLSVTGLSDDDLFADPGHASASEALLTAFAAGDLVHRVVQSAVHVIDIAGRMDVYQRSSPGADLADPDSFKVGNLVASFELTLQDVLAVFAPAKGLPTLTGDMRQTESGALTGGTGRRKFGRRGLRLRLTATGLGELVDPATLNSFLDVSGSWAAV